MNVIDLTKAARECGFELSVELVVDTNGGQDQVRYVLTGPLNYEKATTSVSEIQAWLDGYEMGKTHSKSSGG